MCGFALALAIGVAAGVAGASGAATASASPVVPDGTTPLSSATTVAATTTSTVPGVNLPLPVTTVSSPLVPVTTTSAPVLTNPPADSPAQSGMVGNFIPSDGVPASTPADGQYEIMYSTGGGLFASADVGRQATGMFTGWIFEGNVWTVHAALWLDHWALTFHVADALGGPAQALANSYQTDIVGPLGIGGIALMFCVFTAFWYCIRGRGTKGMGELAVSLLVLMVTACAWAQPGTLLLGNNGVLGHVRDLSTGLAAITTSMAAGTNQGAYPAACSSGGESNDNLCDDELQEPLLGNIHNSFVEVPYELLNWGQQLNDPAGPSPCYPTEQQILAQGPWGTSDTPRDMMSSAGCGNLATFNADPSPDRLIGSILCLTAGLLLLLQALIIAGATILAELSVVALVVVFPFVVPFGLLPGGGRGLLWAWVTKAIRSMLVLVVTCMTLSLMLVTISSLLTYMSGDPLFEVFIVLNFVVVGAIIARGRISKALRRMADSAGQRLNGSRIGGSQGRRWLAPAAGGFGAAELASHLYRARRMANSVQRASGLRSQLAAGAGAGMSPGSTRWPGPGQGGSGGTGSPGGTSGPASPARPGPNVPASAGAAPSANSGPIPPSTSGAPTSPGTSPPGPAKSGGGKAATAKRAIGFGVDAALTVASGGSSAAVSRVAKGALMARRASAAMRQGAAARSERTRQKLSDASQARPSSYGGKTRPGRPPQSSAPPAQPAAKAPLVNAPRKAPSKP